MSLTCLSVCVRVCVCVHVCVCCVCVTDESDISEWPEWGTACEGGQDLHRGGLPAGYDAHCWCARSVQCSSYSTENLVCWSVLSILQSAVQYSAVVTVQKTRCVGQCSVYCNQQFSTVQ